MGNNKKNEDNAAAFFIDFAGNEITEKDFEGKKIDISDDLIEGFASRTYSTSDKNSKSKSNFREWIQRKHLEWF